MVRKWHVRIGCKGLVHLVNNQHIKSFVTQLVFLDIFNGNFQGSNPFPSSKLSN